MYDGLLYLQHSEPCFFRILKFKNCALAENMNMIKFWRPWHDRSKMKRILSRISVVDNVMSENNYESDP